MNKPQINQNALFSGELFNISLERSYELADYFAEDCENFMRNKLSIGELLTKLLEVVEGGNEIAYSCFTVGMLSEVKRDFHLDINLEGTTIEEYFKISPERSKEFIDNLVYLERGEGKTPKLKFINGVLSMALNTTERLYLMHKATVTFMELDAKSNGVFSMIEKIASEKK